MRKLLQYLLKKPLTWFANYLAASPKREIVFKSLSELYESTTSTGERITLVSVDLQKDKIIVFSDQHKGNKSWADDFNICEKNYIAALQFYNEQQYCFINLGDSEELWKFKATEIIPANFAALAAESAFQPYRYYKTFGNHDLIWKNKLDVEILLKKIFVMPMPVYEGIILRNTYPGSELDILLTHGHQGDLMSDNNAVSTWIVAHIWTPLQRYLRININSPSNDHSLRNAHNKMMYEWSSNKGNLILITGHTHQPVFAAGKYFDHPAGKIPNQHDPALIKPSYFNTGCCCYNDGDITGIEIEGGYIRLVSQTLKIHFR